MDAQGVMHLWNSTAKQHGLPIVRALTDQRRRSVEARLRKWHPEAIAEALGHVAHSRFLRGECPNEKHPGWRLAFDDFISERIFVRILEGRYDDDRPQEKASTIDPHYALKSHMEHFLRTGRWLGGGDPPTRRWPADRPRSVLEAYRERFRAIGKELAP